MSLGKLLSFYVLVRMGHIPTTPYILPGKYYEFRFSYESSRLPDSEKVCSHSLHKYGFSPVWIILCFFRMRDSEKVCSQSLQEYGFSPV